MCPPLISGYAQNCMIEQARRVFDEMPERDEVSWNALISAYMQCRNIGEANWLFAAMPHKNIGSRNTMVTGYAQAGMIEEAHLIFDPMPRRDSISWAAMIAGYSQCGSSEEAFLLFIEMGRTGERVNRSSFTCILSTCADVAMLECGKQLHEKLVKAGYGVGCFVGNALIAMYCKCGSIDEAFEAFKEMANRDVV